MASPFPTPPPLYPGAINGAPASVSSTPPAMPPQYPGAINGKPAPVAPKQKKTDEDKKKADVETEESQAGTNNAPTSANATGVTGVGQHGAPPPSIDELQAEADRIAVETAKAWEDFMNAEGFANRAAAEKIYDQLNAQLAAADRRAALAKGWKPNPILEKIQDFLQQIPTIKSYDTREETIQKSQDLLALSRGMRTERILGGKRGGGKKNDCKRKG